MRIYTRRDVLAEGHSDRDIARLIREGTLTRLTPGVYVQNPLRDPVQFHAELSRWCELPDSWVWSHGTAAILHGLPMPAPPAKLMATGVGEGRSHMRALVKRSTARLQTEDLTLLGSLPVTTAARTVVDVARTFPFATGVVIADAARLSAARAGNLARFDVDLREALERTAAMKGCRRARQVLAASRVGAESPMETRSRLVIASLGFPEPVLQFEVRDRSGNFLGRADAAWPEHGVLGEYDGQGKYRELRRTDQSADDVLLAERRRQLRFEDAGWVVIRWGKEELADPRLLRAKLESGFERAGRLRSA